MSPEPSFPSSGRPCESAVLNAFMLAGLTSFARDVDFVSIAGSGLVTDIRLFSATLHMMFLCLLGLDGLWTFCASGQTVVIEELVDAALSARCSTGCPQRLRNGLQVKLATSAQNGSTCTICSLQPIAPKRNMLGAPSWPSGRTR